MASGRKNYFRHSFFAVEDEKIQRVIDEMGFEGYGYYFSLLELLGRKCSESVENPITIHQQSLRSLWRKHSKSCRKVVEKLHKSGLFVATFKGNNVEFDIPNLSKYLGKYTDKMPPNGPNKRKEKKKKVKEIKEKETEIKYPEEIKTIVNYLNEKLGTNYRTSTESTRNLITARINSKYTVDDFKRVIDFKTEEWRDNSEMCGYLQPSTLFSPKFEKYLNTAILKKDNNVNIYEVN